MSCRPQDFVNDEIIVKIPRSEGLRVLRPCEKPTRMRSPSQTVFHPDVQPSRIVYNGFMVSSSKGAAQCTTLHAKGFVEQPPHPMRDQNSLREVSELRQSLMSKGAHLLRGCAEGAPVPVLRIAEQVAQEAECCVRLHPLPVVLEPLLERARLCHTKSRGRSWA